MRRREFLRAGLAGLAGLTLPDLIALRARAETDPRASGPRLVVWLQGGASHLETYDPKPDAPAEFRGPFGSIATKAGRAHQRAAAAARPGGRQVRDPALAGAHRLLPPAGNQQMFTGHPEQVHKLKPDHPDLMCVAHRLRSDPGRRVPDLRRRQPDPVPRLGLPRPGLRAVRRPGDPNAPGFAVPEIGLRGRRRRSPGWRAGWGSRAASTGSAARVDDRLQSDDLRRLPAAGDHAPDQPRGAAGVRPRAGKTRGSATATAATPGASAACWPGGWSRRAWSSSTTSLDGPLCGRVGNWDDHAVNHHVFDAMKARCRYFDQAVTALIEDIHARGLDRRVLVVVTGEFGRTPRISYAKDAASGVTQPGRDHWPRAVSLLWAAAASRAARSSARPTAAGPT